MKKESLIKKAAAANGRSRACKKCEFYHKCMFDTCEVCNKSFVEGYMKGYNEAKKAIKTNR